MGEVYKARDVKLNRLIALKTLNVEKLADADRKRRPLLEAQAGRIYLPFCSVMYFRIAAGVTEPTESARNNCDSTALEAAI